MFTYTSHKVKSIIIVMLISVGVIWGDILRQLHLPAFEIAVIALLSLYIYWVILVINDAIDNEVF